MTNHSTPRRVFMGQAAAVVGGLLGTGTPGRAAETRATSTRSSSQQLSAYTFSGQVWVRVGDRHFTCYRAHPTQKYPYFFPIAGPLTGLPMTDESGVQYPHHRSLFLACDRVNGANFWQEENARGQIVSRGPGVEVAADKVIVTDVCDWRQPDHDPVLLDRRRWTITAPAADQRIIDADIQLAARVDVSVAQTNHSLFAIRAAHDLTPAGGGALLDSEGRSSEKATFGEAAAWCGFSGQRHDQTESIVLIDHPRNPWSPCKWFTRDYGFISPTPFNWIGAQGWKLPAGESIRLRYRVVIAGGPIDRAGMNRLAEQFASAPPS